MFNIHKRILPPLGHRIVKTAAAVYICLLIYMLRGYNGYVAQSCITAILCVQPYLEDSKSFAVNRIVGTLIGAAWGFFYLLIMHLCPVLHSNMAVAYFVMSFVVMLAIYGTVLMKMTSTAAQVSIVLLGIVINYPYVESPLTQTLNTLTDTIIGTLVAITVNVAHMPRRKHPEYMFFVRTMDLVPDRFAQIPSSVHITLDHLYKDGAKICLVSRWAPAFIISQMGLLNVNAPMIIMDGAGLYDIKENKYLDVIDIPHQNAERLKDIILNFGACFNIYTLHDRSMCIYHAGEYSQAEHDEYQRMKCSPYRNYLEGSYHEEDKIAFIRVIDTPEKIDQLAYLVQSVLPPGMFRMEIRQEASSDFKGLYFYDINASVANMKAKVLNYSENELGVKLIPKDILPRLTHYLPEHDAMLLLGRVKTMYEPIDLFASFRKKP